MFKHIKIKKLIIIGVLILGVWIILSSNIFQIFPIVINSNQNKEIQGEITWLDEPIAIKPYGLLNIFSKLNGKTLFDSQQRLGEPLFYKVGIWKTGLYAGSDIIDIQIPQQQAPFYELIRVSVKLGALVIFPNSSNLYYLKMYTQKVTGHPYYQVEPFDSAWVFIDLGTIPGIVPPYQVLNLVSNKNNLTFNIDTTGNDVYGGHFFDNDTNSKTLVATFPKGQKLYSLNQSLTPIPWSNLEQPYSISELDHIDYHLVTEEKTFSMQDLQWIQKPDLLVDLYPDLQSKSMVELNPLDQLNYELNTPSHCGFLYVNKYRLTSSFNLNTSKLVAVLGNNKFYLPDVTYTNTFLQSIFKVINQKNNLSSKLSYNRYLTSFPLLIWQDSLGIYQVLYRTDYPWMRSGNFCSSGAS